MIVTSSYSQSSFQRTQVINGDTVVVITMDEAKKINKTFISKNHYKTVNDSLSKKVVLLKARVQNDSVIIGDLKFQIDKLEEVLINEQKVTDKLIEDLEATDKQLRKVKRKNVIKRVGLGVSVGLNAVLVILLSTK